MYIYIVRVLKYRTIYLSENYWRKTNGLVLQKSDPDESRPPVQHTVVKAVGERFLGDAVERSRLARQLQAPLRCHVSPESSVGRARALGLSFGERRVARRLHRPRGQSGQKGKEPTG